MDTFVRSDIYQKHLQSDYWNRVKQAVKARAGFRCQACNSDALLHAHHRTYEHFGNELNHLDDMTCFCKRCHSLFHGNELPRKNIGMGLAAAKIHKPSLSHSNTTLESANNTDTCEMVEVTVANHKRLKCSKEPWHWMKREGIDPQTKGWAKRAIGRMVPRHFLH